MQKIAETAEIPTTVAVGYFFYTHPANQPKFKHLCQFA